jgi:photosystem II stability/assembly factor-like uncharacterized protein
MEHLSNSRLTFGRATAMLVVAAGVVSHTTRAATWSAINTGLPGVSTGVNSLAIDPASPSTIYAQTVSNSSGSVVVNSLFKTTDGGATWGPVGGAAGVTCLVLDPANSSTIYAGTDKGVIKSTNAGGSWTDVSSNLPSGSVTRLVIDPATPSTLYAVTTTAPISTPGGPILMSIYKTTDSGASWSPLNTGLPASAYIAFLTISPATPSTLYTYAPPFDPTGTGGPFVGGLLKSTDGGQTWKTLSLSALFVNSLVVDPVASFTLYATTSMGLLKSLDAGETWSSLASGLPPNTSVTLVVVDRASPSVVYAASVSFGPTGQIFGILKSVDGAKTWTAFNVGLPPGTAINSLVVDPLSPSSIYAGASGISFGPPTGVGNGSGGGASGGVFKSTDGGVTWNSASTGLVSLDVRTLAMNSANAGAIYAGGFGGTSRSTDGGATWNSTGLSAYTGTLVADSANPDVVYALTGSANGCNSSDGLLLRTTDGGANWSNSVSPLNSGCILSASFPSSHATPIALDPADPNTLYLGESEDEDGYSAVLKTIDRGADWTAPWDWFNGLRGAVRVLAIDPLHPATIFAGIDDGSAALGPLQAGPNSSGLFKSTDGGASWNNSGLTAGAVNLLAVDPSNSQIVYAGAEGHYTQPAGFQGLSRSTNGGLTWQAVNAGLAGLIGLRSTTATALIIDPANSQVLYLGTSNSGVFRTADGGTTWSPFNDGLTSLQVRVLAAGPSHAVYAVTSAGIFKYTGL